MLCRAGSWEATFILPRAHFCWGIRWRKRGWNIQTAILHDQSSSTIKFLLLTWCWLYACTWKNTVNALSDEMWHSKTGNVQKAFLFFPYRWRNGAQTIRPRLWTKCLPAATWAPPAAAQPWLSEDLWIKTYQSFSANCHPNSPKEAIWGGTNLLIAWLTVS